MRYLSEFRFNWRSVVAGFVGLGAGGALVTYTLSIFAPSLIAEFGWGRSEFALVGTLSICSTIAIPIAGRLTDLFGVRRVASFGIAALPLAFLAFSFMNGDIRVFFAITIVQLFCTSTTTGAVYGRLVANSFTRARGLALALLISGPASVAAIAAPILTEVIDAHGWRVGYRCLAAFAAIAGIIALVMMPRRAAAPRAKSAEPAAKSTATDYSFIFRSFTFWVILGGMLLCNFAQALPGSQLKLMLLDDGVSSDAASLMFSGYAIGILIGRFFSGVAVDHLPPHLVASVMMALPAIGLFIMASSFNAPWALAFAVFMMGFSQGAEGDMVGFLVMRYFSVDVYSSIVGLVVSGIAAASAAGALILSLTLAATDHYVVFLIFAGTAILIGSALFLLLGGKPTYDPPKQEAEEPAAAT